MCFLKECKTHETWNKVVGLYLDMKYETFETPNLSPTP